MISELEQFKLVMEEGLEDKYRKAMDAYLEWEEEDSKEEDED